MKVSKVNAYNTIVFIFSSCPITIFLYSAYLTSVKRSGCVVRWLKLNIMNILNSRKVLKYLSICISSLFCSYTSVILGFQPFVFYILQLDVFNITL